MLSAHLVISIVPETRCSTISDPPKKYKVVAHRLVFIVTRPQSAGQHIATAMEGRFVRHRGKQPQSDVVGEGGVPEVSLV
jgi:hypothetical protein